MLETLDGRGLWYLPLDSTQYAEAIYSLSDGTIIQIPVDETRAQSFVFVYRVITSSCGVWLQVPIFLTSHLLDQFSEP